MTTHGPGPHDPIDRSDVVVRCLGGFELLVDGRSVDLSPLRPRARSVLHLLATHARVRCTVTSCSPRSWSDNDTESARRSLQVAVSSVRKRLESAGWPHGVERVGDGYGLAVEPHDVTDVRAFRRADRRRAAGRTPAATMTVSMPRRGRRSIGTEVTCSPRKGSADWVVEAREALRMAAGATARLAATTAYQRGDMGEALTMAERGLQLDRFDDTMWNVVIDAHAARGETSAAVRARRTYDGVLEELGSRHFFFWNSNSVIGHTVTTGSGKQLTTMVSTLATSSVSSAIFWNPSLSSSVAETSEIVPSASASRNNNSRGRGSGAPPCHRPPADRDARARARRRLARRSRPLQMLVPHLPTRT